MPCSDCNIWDTCGGVQMVKLPDLNTLECTAAKIQMQRGAGVDTLGDRTVMAGALTAAGCPLTVAQWVQNEACPVPSGASLTAHRAMLVGMGITTLADPAPDSAALQFLGMSCTDDCCQGGSPAATYCGDTNVACLSEMSMKIPDSHAMAIGCMNNQYIFDRLYNSSTSSTGGPLNAVPNQVLPVLQSYCKPMLATTDLPCVMGTLVFGAQNAVCCEAAAIVTASEIMSTAGNAAAANIAFCPAHGTDMGGCEADNKTPTATAFANAQAAIMASSCACGGTIMATLGTTEKALLDKDGDNVLDACSTTTTTTTVAAKKKDSSAAGLTVSLTALASAALATVF